MPRPLTPLPKNTEKHMQELLKQAVNAWEVRRIQCILMRTAREMPSQDIAPLVGLQPASVRRIWKRYLDEGDAALIGEKRGKARGHAHLTIAQEKKLLQPLIRRAEQGQLLTVRLAHVAVCKAVGEDVDFSTTYRMLARHGWRKIVPLSEHPKGDKEARETFRESFSPTR